MFCENCGNKTGRNQKFCSSCGSPIIDLTEEAVKTQENDVDNLVKHKDVSGVKKSEINNKNNNNVVKKNQKSIVFGILGGIAIITVIVILLIVNPFGKNKLDAESMIGTWEFVDAPYYITIRGDSTFEIEYFDDELDNDRDTRAETVFMGKLRMSNSDIYLSCTYERTNPRDSWTSSSTGYYLKYSGVSSDNIYSFRGGSSINYLSSVRLKKMVMPDDYSKVADERTMDLLNSIYTNEGNFKLTLISSEWSTDKDDYFIEGTCNFFAKGENTILAPMMIAHASYNLSRKGNQYTPTRLSIMNYETTESSIIYNYDSTKGTFTRTNEKLVLPND